jgi:hypothetical protein
MAKTERKITGAVSIPAMNRTFVAGQEGEFAAAAGEHKVDLVRLEKAGAISGFGSGETSAANTGESLPAVGKLGDHIAEMDEAGVRALMEQDERTSAKAIYEKRLEALSADPNA